MTPRVTAAAYNIAWHAYLGCINTPSRMLDGSQVGRIPLQKGADWGLPADNIHRALVLY